MPSCSTPRATRSRSGRTRSVAAARRQPLPSPGRPVRRRRSRGCAAARAAGVERILVPGLEPALVEGALGARRAVDRPRSSPSASTRTTPPRPTSRPGARSSASPAGPASSRSARPASTTTASSRRSTRSWSTCAATSPSPARPRRPVVLHCRSAAGRHDAQDALLRELDAAALGVGPAERPAAIIHSYSGPLDYGREVIARGFAVSFSGLVFRRGEEPSAEVAALVPRGPAAGRDGLAVPLAARRSTPPERAGVGARDRGLAGGTARQDVRGPRRRPRPQLSRSRAMTSLGAREVDPERRLTGAIAPPHAIRSSAGATTGGPEVAVDLGAASEPMSAHAPGSRPRPRAGGASPPPATTSLARRQRRPESGPEPGAGSPAGVCVLTSPRRLSTRLLALSQREC